MHLQNILFSNNLCGYPSDGSPNREIIRLEKSVVQEILTAIISVIGERDAALHEPYLDERETVEA